MGTIYAFLMRGIKFENDHVVIMLTDNNTITYSKDNCKITCNDDMVINVECRDPKLKTTVNFTTSPSEETVGMFSPAVLLKRLGFKVKSYDDGRLVTGFISPQFKDNGDIAAKELIVYLNESVESFDSIMVPTSGNGRIIRSLNNPESFVSEDRGQHVCTFCTSEYMFHGIIVGSSFHTEDSYELGA